MRLLSTDRAELHDFAAPEDVPGGYAILSHVWGKQEQSFQDIKLLAEAVQGTSESPRDRAGSKIRACCELAEKHGYRWVWIDTCCIDKTSSAELSEAINSMFRYYSMAEICYAYLEDVSSASDNNLRPTGLYSKAFRNSKWHTRGWTLQELIAPKFLVFLSKEWLPLATKSDLAPTLELITEIPVAVLKLELHFTDISVAQRMSWAARRETTREEDRAYSLFGIFDINMPTLYGEGQKAFQRLQEEILRNNPDTTLFAWGHCSSGADRLPPLGSSDHIHKRASYLFASSPSDFVDSSHMYHGPSRLSTNHAQSNDVSGVSVLRDILPHDSFSRLLRASSDFLPFL